MDNTIRYIIRISGLGLRRPEHVLRSSFKEKLVCNIWYRYVFSNKSYYEMLEMDKAADEIMGEISDYMGPVFEDICRQYLIRQAKAGKLPFVPYVIGKWWGE